MAITGIVNATPGFSVVQEVSDGASAVAACERFLPDIAVLDFHMPYLDGVRAASIIMQRHPGIRIAIDGTFMEADEMREAISIGIRDCWFRPLDPPQLASMLTTIAAA